MDNEFEKEEFLLDDPEAEGPDEEAEAEGEDEEEEEIADEEEM